MCLRPAAYLALPCAQRCREGPHGRAGVAQEQLQGLLSGQRAAPARHTPLRGARLFATADITKSPPIIHSEDSR
jgi:hypothetical protein